MARPKKQLNRRTDILDAAQRLFADKGFDKTTIDEIAKSIGVSKGSIYLDFKNKDDILLAIAERNVLLVLEQVEIQINNAKAPFIQHIKNIILNDISTIFDMALSQVHSHITLIHTSYHVRQKLDHLMQKNLNLMASLLEKAAKNGEIRLYKDYNRLSYLIDIVFQGYFPPYDIKYSPSHRTDLTKEEIRKLLLDDASTVIEIILSGLKNIDNTENIKDYINEAKVN